LACDEHLRMAAAVTSFNRNVDLSGFDLDYGGEKQKMSRTMELAQIASLTMEQM
jgi:hypothetical protein